MTQAEAATFPVRDLKFSTDHNIPRHWISGKRSLTNFIDGLSIFFPAGERFFVKSVRAYEKRVKDPVLLRDLKAFCSQEAMHNREHIRYNHELDRKGYPASELDAKVVSLLKLVEKRVPRRMQLAATASLEHFTAMLGHVVLEQDLLKDAHPTMAALWRWHSAEENEHKAVAFDVYLAAGGTYVERCAVMIAATVIFWAKVAEHQARMMNADGIAWDAGEWGALVNHLFVSPGTLRPMWVEWAKWFSPSFHPNDRDDSEVLARWRASVAS